MKDLLRGLNTKCAFILKEIGVIDLIKSDTDLYLGIRNNYVNIYYMGASVAKIDFEPKLRISIANKYLNPNNKSGYTILSFSTLLENLPIIKRNIYDIQNVKQNFEKIAQQKLIQNNNNNSNSSWFCVDMEYVMQRKSRIEDSFGRFDIVVISKKKPYNVALIELKYKDGAFGSFSDEFKQEFIFGFDITKSKIKVGSGILGHICDYVRYLQADIFKSALKYEVVNIINNYNELGLLCPINNISKNDICDEPVIYFITVAMPVDKAREQMKKYLLNIPKSSIYNVQTVLKHDVTVANAMLNPTFLFSKDDGSNIIDIIDDEKYCRGF